jgi:signal transduction histidine kinase
MREVAAELALALVQGRLREDLARHAEELEERVKERTEELETFTYSVSHDLRAPLRAVDGFSRIVREDFGETLPAEAHRYLGLVRENTRAMGELIDGLLEFSRLGRRELSRSRVDLGVVVREVLADLAPELQGRKVELEVGVLPVVTGDRLLLKQVYTNLLSNALKFTSSSSASGMPRATTWGGRRRSRSSR